MHNAIPYFSHDQKDNWKATKIVAKAPIDALNEIMKDGTTTLSINDEDTEDTQTEYDYTNQPDVHLSTWCQTCHKKENECICRENYNFNCPFCENSYQDKKLLETHKLLDHPQNFKKRKLSTIGEFQNFYEKRKKQKLFKNSKHTTQLKLIFSKRKNTMDTLLQAGIKS